MDPETESQTICVVSVSDWRPPGVQRALAASSRNFVGLMDDGFTVLKYPHQRKPQALEALFEEADRYTRVGLHPNLVLYKGVHEHGIMFEYCAKGQLEDVIRSQPSLGEAKKIELGKQILLGLIHLHEHNFIHCDLNVNNVFVTSAMEVKIGDLQGQLYDAEGNVEMPTMSQENPKSRHPHAGEDEFSPRTDIFALGTLFYHLWYGHPPFPELDEHLQEDIVQARYRAAEFPVDASGGKDMDAIISRCWNSEYEQEHSSESVSATSGALSDLETARVPPLFHVRSSMRLADDGRYTCGAPRSYENRKKDDSIICGHACQPKMRSHAVELNISFVEADKLTRQPNHMILTGMKPTVPDWQLVSYPELAVDVIVEDCSCNRPMNRTTRS
nr:mitogen-activated protein kinase kinase kinase 13-b [Quercus suber]